MGPDRKFDDREAETAWNTGSQAWNQFIESGADYYRTEVHGPALLATCEPVQNLRVLELGCGQGFFCRALAERGARVVGVDLAAEQIALARQHEVTTPLGIEYRIMAAQEVSSHWPSHSFDLVTACMSLQDMAEVEAIFQSAFAVLRPEGRMVFSVPHPCTDTPVRQWERDEVGAKIALKIDLYFESGPQICHWNMPRLTSHWDTPYWHYTLSEWSEYIAKAGFLIRQLHEPRPTAEQVQHNPHLEDCYRLPYFLIFDLIKPG